MWHSAGKKRDSRATGTDRDISQACSEARERGVDVVGPCADNRDDAGHNVEVRCRSPAGDRIKGPSTSSGAQASECSDGTQWRGWSSPDRLARGGDGLDCCRDRGSAAIAARGGDSTMRFDTGAAQRVTKQSSHTEDRAMWSRAKVWSIGKRAVSEEVEWSGRGERGM